MTKHNPKNTYHDNTPQPIQPANKKDPILNLLIRQKQFLGQGWVRPSATKISFNGNPLIIITLSCQTYQIIDFLKAVDPHNPLTFQDDKDNDKYIHKYTNLTCLKDPPCAIFLKSMRGQGYQI